MAMTIDSLEAIIVDQMDATEPQDLFTFSLAGYRNCVLCGLELKSDETLLVSHLERSHKDALEQLYAEHTNNKAQGSENLSEESNSKEIKAGGEMSSSSTSSNNSTEYPTNRLSKLSEWMQSLSSTDETTKALSEWMIKDQVPISVLDDEEFRKCLQLINPKYTLPKSKFLSQLLTTKMWTVNRENNVVLTRNNVRCMRLDEVMLRVHIATISAQDVTALKNSIRSTTREVTTGFGNQIVGTVESFAQGAPSELVSRWEGQRVIVHPVVPCTHCHACASSKLNECPNRICVGNGESDMYGFTERCAFPVRALQCVPSALDDELAILAYPLSVALGLMYELEQIVGDNLAATIGLVGLSPVSVMLYRLLDARRPKYKKTLLRWEGSNKTNDALLAQAKVTNVTSFDSTTTTNNNNNSSSSDSTDDFGTRFDICVECKQSSTGFAVAIKATKPLGTLIVQFLHDRAPSSSNKKSSRTSSVGQSIVVHHPDPNLIVVNELTVVGTQPLSLETTLNFIQRASSDDLLDPSALFSNKINLEDINSTVWPVDLLKKYSTFLINCQSASK